MIYGILGMAAKKYSEGCENCYMYYLDSQRDKDGSDIYKVKTNFNLPLKKKVEMENIKYQVDQF